MKKISKLTRRRVSSLSTILDYICVDLLTDEKLSELDYLEPNEFSKIIDIAYEPKFVILSDVNKKSFSRIINETLEEMTDEEINLVFEEIYFVWEEAENPEFVRGLLLALKDRYKWISE